ncbi:glycosyltransferase [Phreatobacter aquaticus]|uniref:Glycosyltransferase n=1 Tax=Phreatobacter aquaticus TaxID=2570229 RepID=A0A4D7QNW8_9HYPH|nr:glycosyltransferase [Phreatobacter aquaticus]QCK87603.1 glycosyltransferase [Phreatobacter aquaticus]
MKRAIVAIVTDYAPPATRGGAVRALTAMTGAIHDRVDLRVITRDHDALTGAPLEVDSSDRWVRENGIQILRLSRKAVILRSLHRTIAETGASNIFTNSLFSRLTQKLLARRCLSSTALPPLVIAPEGELDAGALAVKPLRKHVWLSLATRTGLLRNVTWKAASEIERAAIRRAVPGATVTLLPYVTRPTPALGQRGTKVTGNGRLLFLSRIAPKKNLRFLLQCLRNAPQGTELTIVGPIDDTAEWESCKRIIRSLPPGVQARYLGEVAPADVWRHYQAADAFVLPTLGENHGYAIEDAVRAGCPPLISDRTPWSFLGDEAAGFVLPLDDSATWTAAIADIVAMDEDRHAAMRARCHAVARRLTSDEKLVDGYVRLLTGTPTD